MLSKPMPRLRSIALAAILFALASASTAGWAQGQALKSYNAAIGDSSISGISSGAFMAVQFGFAWSSIIKGVGVVAGGPFYCAQASAADIINGFTLPLANATGDFRERQRVDPAATGRKLRLADEHATRSLEWDSNPVSP